MDLDDEELKATKELNGTANNEDELKKTQEEANKKIQEAVDKVNKACEELSNIDILKHVMIVGYVDVGAARGFISSNYNLKEMESQTTFLLDFASKNIKESVRRLAKEQADKIKDIIDKEGGVKDETK